MIELCPSIHQAWSKGIVTSFRKTRIQIYFVRRSHENGGICVKKITFLNLMVNIKQQISGTAIGTKFTTSYMYISIEKSETSEALN